MHVPFLFSVFLCIECVFSRSTPAAVIKHVSPTFSDRSFFSGDNISENSGVFLFPSSTTEKTGAPSDQAETLSPFLLITENVGFERTRSDSGKSPFNRNEQLYNLDVQDISTPVYHTSLYFDDSEARSVHERRNHGFDTVFQTASDLAVSTQMISYSNTGKSVVFDRQGTSNMSNIVNMISLINKRYSDTTPISELSTQTMHSEVEIDRPQHEKNLIYEKRLENNKGEANSTQTVTDVSLRSEAVTSKMTSYFEEKITPTQALERLTKSSNGFMVTRNIEKIPEAKLEETPPIAAFTQKSSHTKTVQDQMKISSTEENMHSSNSDDLNKNSYELSSEQTNRMDSSIDSSYEEPVEFDVTPYSETMFGFSDSSLATDETTSSIETTTVDPCTKPDGPVQNLTALPNITYVVLSWDVPKSLKCITGYKIYIPNIVEIYINETTNRTANISDKFELCGSYVVNVATIYNGEEGESAAVQFKMLTPKPLKNVQNLDITQIGNAVNVTWSPPIGESLCVSEYRVTVVSLNETDTWYNKDTYFERNITGCRNYEVYIIPVAGKDHNIDGLIAYCEYNIPLIFVPPKLTPKAVGKRWINLSIEVEPFEENMCEILSINVTCDALSSNNVDKDWVVKHVEYSLDIEDNSRSFTANETDEFSEFTNYTCWAVVSNIAGDSEPSAQSLVRTEEEVPTQPLNLTIEAQSRYFMITWEEPYKVPGIMQKYDIKIISHGPRHFIPEICLTDDRPFHYENPPDRTSFNFTLALPDFSYTIYISAFDRAGEGNYSDIFLITPVAAPEVPRNVSLKLIKNMIDTDSYNVIQKIKWLLPCNTNGPLKSFGVNIFGFYTQDPKNNVCNETVYISRNQNIQDLAYKYSFSLNASYNYVLNVFAQLEDGTTGSKIEQKFISPEGCPTSPSSIQISEMTNTSFEVTWESPQRTNGILLYYVVLIETIGPAFDKPADKECEIDIPPLRHEMSNNTLQVAYSGALSSYMYKISVMANTSAGYGKETSTEAITLEGIPESVRRLEVNINNPPTEEYCAVMTVNFMPPCNTFGRLKFYRLHYRGQRENYGDDYGTIELKTTSYDIFVKPEYSYSVQVEVLNSYFSNFSKEEITVSPSGVPPLQGLDNLEAPKANGTDQAVFTFTKDSFNETNGKILYCALLIEEFSDSHVELGYGFWYNESGENGYWPDPCITSSCKNARQLTEKRWSPFTDNITKVTFIIGSDSNCTSHEYCNKQLKPATKYLFAVRIFTSETYRDSLAMEFITEEIQNVSIAVILVSIFIGLVLLCAISYFLYIIWKMRLETTQELKLIEAEENDSNGIPPCIPIKQFVNHYNDLKTNYAKLQAEYAALDAKSKELSIPATFALLPENRRKNRYTNILPFDTTRVKLLMEEDDEISSDYINASYIRGFSGKVEYIATQGPLQSTCKDFWKMVIQERVTIIAMVSQFVEMDKQKCYKYFPNNHEIMVIGDDMEVKCLTELDFQIYCIRTLQVRKDVMAYTVTHMQFLGWPDFGCPLGTEYMLQFCLQFRERLRREGGLAVVHCSAGVGRTGTMISIDTLIQTVEEGGDLSIFETVLELRKQRINMVQTEKQYFYIYTCIKDFIENPSLLSINDNNSSSEPIYENLNTIRGCIESALLEQESESAL